MGFGERDDYNNKLHVVQFLQSLNNNNKKKTFIFLCKLIVSFSLKTQML